MFLEDCSFTGASYLPFGGDRRIPADALKTFSNFTVTVSQFQDLVTSRELPKSRYIFLQKGKIIFDCAPLPPCGCMIGEMMGQMFYHDLERHFLGGARIGKPRNM